MKKNCWDVKRCGRGPDGKKDCLAAQDSTLNGVHGGIKAGRACWVATGTRGNSATPGEFAWQLKNCFRCDFYKLVASEEQNTEYGFSSTRLGMIRTLQIMYQSRHAATNKEDGSIDANLLDEFAQEVKKMMADTDDATTEGKRGSVR